MPDKEKPITRKEFFSHLPKEVLGLFTKIYTSLDELNSIQKNNDDGRILRSAFRQFQKEYFKEIEKYKIDKQEAIKNYYYFFHRPAKRLFRWLENEKQKLVSDVNKDAQLGSNCET